MNAAARKVLGAGWQRCRGHFERNLPARAGKTNKPIVSAVMKTILAETDRDQGHARWREVADTPASGSATLSSSWARPSTTCCPNRL